MSEKKRARRIAADEAHAWARNLRLGNAHAKYVLCMLTLYVNGEGICFVSVPQLAEDCELAPDTIRRRLIWLEQVGVLVRRAQWIDDNGRRNAEARGRRTSDEIALLINADVAGIEQAATSSADPSSVPPSAVPGAGVQGADEPGSGDGVDSVSPPAGTRLAPALPPGAESSEPEPEQEEESPPTPPPGGISENLDDGEGKPFSNFVAEYPDQIVTNYPLAQRIWSALTEAERDAAILGAKGYARYVRNERDEGRNRPIKDAHRWLQDRMWQGYVESGKNVDADQRRAAKMFEAIEGGPEWKAWMLFYRIVGSDIPAWRRRGATGKEIANLPSQWPPIGNVFDGRETLYRIYQGTPEFAAWMRKLREVEGIRISLRTDFKDGKYLSYLIVPSQWPPSKDGKIYSTGPPTSSTDDKKAVNQ